MSSQRGNDFWAEIGSGEEDQTQIGIIYRRRRPENITSDIQINRDVREHHRLSLAASKRISWNRSLTTRGRKSVVISTGMGYKPQPEQREAKKKLKQTFLNKRIGQHPPDFSKEREYFQEVDSYELMEESPSPKNFHTWAMGTQNIHFVPDLSTILERWMIGKKLNYSCRPSGSLSKILETPRQPMNSIFSNASTFEETPGRTLKNSLNKINASSLDHPINRHTHAQQSSIGLDMFHMNEAGEVRKSQIATEVLVEGDTGSEDLGEVVKKLSLTSLGSDHFTKLLMVCEQSAPSRLCEVFSHYCDLNNIVKIGEGTYGEAFKAGATVCKIVPIDGDLRVNGEVQKTSAELLEEVLLCWTLNSLRGNEGLVSDQNTCITFIETKEIRVCQGAYDPSLIKAWEEWDGKHGSENDHPKDFPEKQCYVVFVLADGGRDLESFVLLNFDEARSLLVQVTAALAVAEVAFEFEHRDLHWGNILLARNGATTAEFTLQGRQMHAKTFGLSISIIDFTLSRINTGEAILFLDLSADPGLFEGPKGDKQSETYRKMKEVTEEFWESSIPKTNVLWLQYLVDILLLKKTFQRTAKDERSLRSFRKSLNSYDSAKDALSDVFFNELWVDHNT